MMLNRSRPKWFFVKENPNDRIRSTTRRLASGATDLSAEARVAREAIQNSADATIPDHKTHILIWNKTIPESEVDAFRELIGFSDRDSPFRRGHGKLGLSGDSALARMASKRGDRSFPVTIIEDYNTVGLAYDPAQRVDRFDELCISQGQDTTQASAERGGSYGFGKAVYEEASDSNMFIVYSVFDPHPDATEKDAHARLFICATFNGHQHGRGNVKYTGRALYGVHRKRQGYTLCRPVTDSDAHSTAQKLGFTRRDKNTPGTSIMIIGSKIDTDEIRAAIEDNWWPRMWSNMLSVELWHGDHSVDPPDPKKRSDLAPYTRGYSTLTEDIPLTPPDKKNELHQRASKGNPALKQGALYLTPLPESDDESDRAEDDTYLRNTVALIRSGPKMVVEYMPPGGRAAAAFSGVFVSHPDIEKQLHLSEPPPHDTWNHNSPRLDEFYADDQEALTFNRRAVRTTIQKIKTRARNFRRDLAPLPTPTPVSGTPALRTILGRLISTPGGRRPPPPRPTPRPFDFGADGHRREIIGDQARIVARAELTLNERSDAESAEADVTFTPVILLDDDKRRDPDGYLSIDSASVNDQNVDVDAGNTIRVKPSRQSMTVVQARTEKFARELYASVDVSVNLIEPAQEQAAP